MKYKGILIFLIICIIVFSLALITYAYLSKDIKNASNNVTASKNTITNGEENVIKNNITENNTTRNNTDENTSSNTINVDNANGQDNTNSNTKKQENKETFSSEEEVKETEKSKENKQNTAINLTKEEWGEDDTVYYTIDREQNNVYDISVRSKSTTQTLAEYEVDIENKTVQIKWV